MERIPEPELMEDPVQARAYAGADFEAPHSAFLDGFGRCFPDHRPRRVLDLGCGPGDIGLRFLRRYTDCHLTGVDGSAAMLDLARRAAREAGLEHRAHWLHQRLPAPLGLEPFDTLISNSLLHHLHDPGVLWCSLRELAAPGAAVYVVDLRRPASPGAARALVAQYAAGEPAILQRDFLHSLQAAFRPDEVRRQLDAAGLAGWRVEAVGDRHLRVWGRGG